MAHKFKKQFGQNFLRGDRFALELVSGISPTAGDLVIEIGPGDGRVTRLLLDAEVKLTAIEVDYDLVVQLVRKFGQQHDFQLVHQDILDANIPEIVGDQPYKVIGSLPYNISKQIIAKFLDLSHPPTVMSFILQEEVADDYNSKAPKASFLGNWIRLFADVKKLKAIPKQQFFPVPKVNGGILQITPHIRFAAGERLRLAALIRLAFRQPRKTLANNLKPTYDPLLVEQAVANLELSTTIRPSELTQEQWIALDLQLNHISG